MHALLLSLLGPWALDYNAVVWPWNVAMPFILYELFWSSGLPASEVLRSGEWRSQWAAIVLFALLPALSLVDLWDDNLSFSLYGGNTLFADVILPSTTLSRLAPRARQVAQGLPDGRFRLALDDWAHEALHVPAYTPQNAYIDGSRESSARWQPPRISSLFYSDPARGCIARARKNG